MRRARKRALKVGARRAKRAGTGRRAVKRVAVKVAAPQIEVRPETPVASAEAPVVHDHLSDLLKTLPSPPGGIEMIGAEELMALTGFSDSWHRKIADRGFYPPPLKGMYQKMATIQGLFKNQRELVSKAKENLARKHEDLLDRKIAQADHDLGVAREEFKPTSEVAKSLLAICEEQKSTLTFQLLDQLPALNAGLSAIEQRKNNRECLVAICKRLQDWAILFSSAECGTRRAELGTPPGVVVAEKQVNDPPGEAAK